MSNKSKAKGTTFETWCVEYLRERLHDGCIERRALHGSRDLGDIYNLFAHGYEGIVECKNVAKWGDAELERWKGQTIDERGNADADFSLLVVHRNGVGRKRFGLNHCYMQVRDLERIVGGDFTCLAGESAKDTWICMPLDVACQHILGQYEE